MGEILWAVHDNPGIDYTKLAETVNVDKKRVQENVDALIEHGYVTNERGGYRVSKIGAELISKSQNN